MVWMLLEGKGSVRCTQNPYCRGQLSARNKRRGNNCAECGWWWKGKWHNKKYNSGFKMVDVKFLQDMLVEGDGE